MRRTSVWRQIAAGPTKPFPHPAISHLGRASWLAALATVLLTGCAADVPLPDSALLEQLQTPRCEYRKGSSKKEASPASDSDENARTKLDYERQCYRHAEMIARTRLKALQKSVSRTVLALRAERVAQARGPQQMIGP
jgi:hypothetical protein